MFLAKSMTAQKRTNSPSPKKRNTSTSLSVCSSAEQNSSSNTSASRFVFATETDSKNRKTESNESSKAMPTASSVCVHEVLPTFSICCSTNNCNTKTTIKQRRFISLRKFVQTVLVSKLCSKRLTAPCKHVCTKSGESKTVSLFRTASSVHALLNTPNTNKIFFARVPKYSFSTVENMSSSSEE